MSDKPKCPSPARLEELMSELEPTGTEGEILQALEWLHTHLTNRRTYHQLHTRQKNLAFQLLKAEFPEKLEDIKTAAANAVEPPDEGLEVLHAQNGK